MVVSVVTVSFTLLSLWLLLRWRFFVNVFAGIGVASTYASIMLLLPFDPKLATPADNARKDEFVAEYLKPDWFFLVFCGFACAVSWLVSSVWNLIR
jgi:hypothetical protein